MRSGGAAHKLESAASFESPPLLPSVCRSPGLSIFQRAAKISRLFLIAKTSSASCYTIRRKENINYDYFVIVSWGELSPQGRAPSIWYESQFRAKGARVVGQRSRGGAARKLRSAASFEKSAHVRLFQNLRRFIICAAHHPLNPEPCPHPQRLSRTICHSTGMLSSSRL